MIITHFCSMSSHAINTATVPRFIFIRMTLSAAFVNVPGSDGKAKRLCVPRFGGYLSVSGNLLIT